MKDATRYLWIAYTAARSNLAYAGEVFYRSSFMAIILYIFMRLWTVVYEGSGKDRLGGLTLPQMLWYLVITEAVFMSVSPFGRGGRPPFLGGRRGDRMQIMHIHDLKGKEYRIYIFAWLDQKNLISIASPTLRAGRPGR